MKPHGGVKVRGYYRHSCVVCGGVNTDERLIYGAPCPKCLKEDDFKNIVSRTDLSDYAKLMKEYYFHSVKSSNSDLEKLMKVEELLEDFEEFFFKATQGFKLWSAQRMWAKRIFSGKSFSIVAPTGVGKTLFGLLISLYLVKGSLGKVYLVFPTRTLLNQAYLKMLSLIENAKLGDKVKVLALHANMPKLYREEALKVMRSGEFNVLMTTSKFMLLHKDELSKHKYKLIFIDDVDAVLRSGRSVRALLEVMGFRKEIDAAIEALKLMTNVKRLSGVERQGVKERLMKLKEVLASATKGIDTVLVVSSATGRPRGLHPKLFRLLLGFEAGSRGEMLRNIVDAYLMPRGLPEEEVLKLVKRLGDGGLIYVTVDKGIEYSEFLAKYLKQHGVRAETLHARKDLGILKKFLSREVDVLVGVATYYGVMVRGLDLPERVRYTIFVGVPRHKLSINIESIRVQELIKILSILKGVIGGDERRTIDNLYTRITSKTRRMTAGSLAKLNEELEKAIKGGVFEKGFTKILLEAVEVVRRLLARTDVLEKLRNSGEVSVVEEEGKIYIMLPDAATYIQASGRASRMYPGGLTKGLSIIIVDDLSLLHGIERRLKYIFEEFSLKDLSTIDLEKVIVDIDKDRDIVKKILEGEAIYKLNIKLPQPALLVVESPNKAKTIASFFGRPSIRALLSGLKAYEVVTEDYILTIVASGGHVYDLAVDAGVHGYGVHRVNGLFIPEYTDIKKCLDCGYQFTNEDLICPKCRSQNIHRKLDVIKALRELASEVDVVFIGTDPDTEGEKIAWDLAVLLRPFSRSVMRVEFHEVTRKAVINAIKNCRDLNTALVESQIVRRIEDRWLGFALSQKLWYDLWPWYCVNILKRSVVECCSSINKNWSAGRVQTPVLNYVIERFYERKQAESCGAIKYVVTIGDIIKLELDYGDLERAGLSEAELERSKAIVELIGVVEEEINPPPPYTTDTLLADASLKYGLSSTKIMEVAQDLFEMGLITYHRTDSIRVSDVGIRVAADYISERYGDMFKELFKPRTWGVGGAHEAIRPTRPIDAERLLHLVRENILVLPKPLTRHHLQVYDLIFRRFISSQMTSAIVRKQLLKVKFNESLVKSVEVHVEPPVKSGFLEVYSVIALRKPVEQGEYYITKVKKVLPPLPKFHDVVKWMKENGVGRPSTYAKIIQTLIDRRYIKVSPKVKALYPTQRAFSVAEFFNEFFREIVSVETTRKLEELMTMIEEGRKHYQDVLENIYKELEVSVLGVDSSKWRKRACREEDK